MERSPGVADTETDAALMLASGSDSSAFGLLYDRHVDFLLAWVYRRTGDAEVAADITMETFAAAYVSRHRYDPAYASARPWLVTIARRQVMHLIRRRQLSTKHRDRLGVLGRVTLDQDDLERIEHLADFAPTRDAIRDALQSLPSKQAEAVWMRIGLDLPYDVVASRLGCSVGAARVRVTRGLSRLMDIVEPT
jgi:RNA polymerase sigma factor (sigma-70 family)